MKRKILEKLTKWKNQGKRKPLLVRGARQVGKSWIIKHFGAQFFQGKLHIINLEQKIDWHSIFDQNLDPKRIVNELEILLNTSINTGNDLVFFDEIQECPKAILSLRYFFEEMPELHIIAAGSLLEFALRDIAFPVGRIQMINMYPLSFSEFLHATDNEKLASVISESPKGLPKTIHKKINQELKNYFFVGGMPESVNTYIDTGKMLEVQEIQSDLINTYRQDFSKYKPLVDPRCINDILSTLSGRVGQQLKYEHLSDRFSGPTIKKALGLLAIAKLINPIYASAPSGLPLSAYTNKKRFKATFVDIGLMVRMSGLSIAHEFQKTQLLSIFKGALAEQFVGQELLASGHEQLYYWSRNQKSSNAEVDYIIEKEGAIIPLEVKNSASGRLKSLHLLLKEYPNVKEGLVLSDASFGVISEQNLKFWPLYYAGTLGKTM